MIHRPYRGSDTFPFCRRGECCTAHWDCRGKLQLNLWTLERYPVGRKYVSYQVCEYHAYPHDPDCTYDYILDLPDFENNDLVVCIEIAFQLLVKT